MTKEQFIAAHKHQLAGLMLDAIYTGKAKHGAELSIFVSMIQHTVSDRLAAMYDSLQPKPATLPAKPEVTANGKPTTAGVQSRS